MIWWVLLIIMFLFILWGFPHLSFRAACTREIKRQGSSPTSNSKKPFVLSIDQSKRSFGKTIVTGNARGPKPDPGDVLYLEDEEKRIPVVVRRVKTMSMKEEGKGITLRLVLFGAGGDTLSRMAFLTNKREKKNDVPQEAKRPVDVHYPVAVRSSWKETLLFVLITVLAALVCLLCIQAYISDPDLTAGAAVGGIASMVMMIVGFYLLAFYLGFKLTIVSEEQVRIRRFFRTTEYHINNLLFRIYLSSDKKEIWHMQIQDGSGTVLCDITDRQGRYEEACEVFRQARARRQQRNLRRYLMERIFYIPAHIIQDEESEEMSAVPTIMVNSETGRQSIFLFDDEKVMKDDIPKDYDSVIETRLEDAIPYMDLYQVDRLIVFMNSPMVPAVKEIDREEWEKIKSEEAADNNKNAE